MRRHIFNGYDGLRAINFVIVSSVPKSDSKSQISMYFCHSKSKEIKRSVRLTRDEVSWGPAKSSDKASRRKSSLKGCKNQEMYQQTPPHWSSLQNVTVYMLINWLKRKLCPSWINNQGQLRQTDSEKTGLLTGSDCLGSLCRSGFPSLSYPGAETHSIEIISHLSCMWTLVNIVRGWQLIPDVVVHNKLDSSLDSLTRGYALIRSCQQTAHIRQAFPRHGGCTTDWAWLVTSEAHKLVQEKNMRTVNVVWHVCCDGALGDTVGAQEEPLTCLGGGICRSCLEKAGLLYRQYMQIICFDSAPSPVSRHWGHHRN